MENDTNVKLMTMRDLIVAISDAACEVLEDEDKAQQIAGVVLMSPNSLKFTHVASG